ncbi:bifunctional riboflavin kinase/FMN adenylyltransferase [Bifidobacterium aemilianum]|uniref:Bifunctional riboflavin kinase/FMN adenylyltransferase n=1 Tax=Bifidobacterium aemilianum TaxID=2493120 RepID=A0A366K8S7_9BIFI|nr:riboflavin kinase [Bifidobacterium aemilianum]RBP97533.1 bifunctional riboflavin kinase/FMN adenylyltransferase [Bifidobacterium aemilianum]
MKIMSLTPDGSGLVDWPTLSTQKRSVVTVGSFDGMHRGHQALVSRMVEEARKSNALSVVIMFDPRPKVAHTYGSAHDGMELPTDYVDSQALTSIHQRLRVMEELGVDHVLVVRYTLAFAAKSYRFFLGQLVGKLGMRTLVLGKDAVMGSGRTGDAKSIADLAAATGVFEFDQVDSQGPGEVRVPAQWTYQVPQGPGEPADPTERMSKAELRAWSKDHQGRLTRIWSSSNLRYLLAQGRIKAANEILGRAHAVEGLVVHGEQRGREIGFPTVNLADHVEGFIPVDGVYAGWLVDLGEAETTDAADGQGVADQQSVAHGYGSADGKGETKDLGQTAWSGQTDAPGTPLNEDDFHRQLVSDRARMAPGSPWRWPAAISIGSKPTYSERTGLLNRVIEAYAVTDQWLELYGHHVRVEFETFLRPQVKFDSTEELKQALAENVQQTLDVTAYSTSKS